MKKRTYSTAGTLMILIVLISVLAVDASAQQRDKNKEAPFDEGQAAYLKTKNKDKSSKEKKDNSD